MTSGRDCLAELGANRRLNGGAVTSNLQVEANRQNAKLSTGPKSEHGKRVSSMNAPKHRLTAQHLTLFDETEEDFSSL
jgi:hypothetical protein